MFASNHLTFLPNKQSVSDSFSSCSSNSSYPSNASDLSTIWESTNRTSDSSPRVPGSYGSPGRLEDNYSVMTPYNLPEKYGNFNEYCAMPSMAQDLMPSLDDSTSIVCPVSEEFLENQGMLDYANFTTYKGPFCSSFESMHGTPTLEMDLPTPSSIESSMPEDFINPSQTNFIDALNIQSPIRPSKLNFNFQYSPTSDFDETFTYDNSTQGMRYFGSLQSEGKQSLILPTTSSPTRQPHHGEPLATSVSLHQVQAQCSSVKQQGKLSEIKGLKIKRRRGARESRREAKECVSTYTIRYQEKATKPCLWPGCKGKFQRSEHLKRHERTHTNAEFFDCPFCFKPFGRSDNLKSHIKLHTEQGKKSSRTEYFEDALPFWESLNKRGRKTDKDSTKDEEEDDEVDGPRFEG